MSKIVLSLLILLSALPLSADQAPTGSADTAIKAAALAWQIVKDNEVVVDTSGVQPATSILSSSNMDPLAYSEARHFASQAVACASLEPGMAITFKVRGMNRAQPPADVPSGSYIPRLAVDIDHLEVTRGKVQVEASIDPPANVGTATRVNPEVTGRIGITWNTHLGGSTTYKFGFTVKGDSAHVTLLGKDGIKTKPCLLA